MNLERHHRDASALLASVHDIVIDRPTTPDAPAWCIDRGWEGYLGTLDEDAVASCERFGLAQYVAHDATAPASVRALAKAVSTANELPAYDGSATTNPVATYRASERKRAQVAAFAACVANLSLAPARIVDIGSGHGHLTRHLADALDVNSEGWEIDRDRIEAARAIHAGDTRVRFVSFDMRSDGVIFAPGDLVVALHACGDLGERAVASVGAARCALVLVGCCLQKRAGDRIPLVVPARLDPQRLTLPHAVLGLGNVRDGDEGIEADLATRHRARVHRLALRTLLRDALGEIEPGAEMHGVNRRRATHSLDELVAHAFGARALPSPTAPLIHAAEREAWARYASIRRWSLPRDMLARLVETWVALDRAASLAAGGHHVRVATLFEPAISPRNIAIIATPDTVTA